VSPQAFAVDRVGAFGADPAIHPPHPLSVDVESTAWAAALGAAGAAWGAHAMLAPHMAHGLARVAEAALALAVYTALYAATTLALGIGTAQSLWQRLTLRAMR